MIPDAVAELTQAPGPLRGEFLQAARAGQLWRDSAPDHLTASALIVTPERDAVLLVLHRKVGRWLQPGGHLEPGDVSLAAAALREAREESGAAGLQVVSPVPVHLDRHAAPCGQRWHLDVRYVLTAPRGAVTVSPESHDVRWWPLEALPPGDLAEPLAAALAALA